MNCKLKATFIATILVLVAIAAISLYKCSRADAYNDVRLINGALAYSQAPMAEIVEKNSKRALIHCYEVIVDDGFTHTATFAWIEADVKTGIAKELLTDTTFNIYTAD